MLLDTIEICELRAGLEVEKDMMLNKVRSPCLSFYALPFNFDTASFLIYLSSFAVEEDES